MLQIEGGRMNNPWFSLLALLTVSGVGGAVSINGLGSIINIIHAILFCLSLLCFVGVLVVLWGIVYDKFFDRSLVE